MAPTSEPDDGLNYLLLCLKHTEMSRPDFAAIATEAGINNAHNAQRRLKAIVEKGGDFMLVNNAVMSADGTAPTKKSQTPKKPRAKKAATTPTTSKKRKISEATTDDADKKDDVVEDEVSDEVTEADGE